VILWNQVASGILYNSWDAHYQRVNVLQFSHDGAAILSGSEDSGLSVWSVSRLVPTIFLIDHRVFALAVQLITFILTRLLDDDLQSEIPVSYCTLISHTLPVTDIICGVGSFPTCRVLSSSVDHTAKACDRLIFANHRTQFVGSSYGTCPQNLF